MKLRPWFAASSLSCVLLCAEARAQELGGGLGPQLDGRITLGGYASAETFSDPLDGQDRNDFATFSTRFFLNATRLSGERVEATLDLRDKNDFFDKLNRELLQLDPMNTFQVRQVSVQRKPESGSIYFQLGRFPVWEAGSVNVDGASAGYSWNDSFRSGFFGGLNPERTDQRYLQFNRDSYVFGSTLAYQPRAADWSRYLSVTSSLVAQKFHDHLDRLFLFGNVIHQWARGGQFTGLLYLDFVPRVYVQNAYLGLQQPLTSSFSVSGAASAVDVIQYSRNQDQLELLTPSPYKEGSLGFKMDFGAMSFEARGAYGKRSLDQLTRREVSFGPSWPLLLDSRLSVRITGVYRRDFLGNDLLSRAELGYFSKNFELTFDQELGVETASDGNFYHRRVTELGISYHASRALYGTISVQSSATERVSVYGTFFRIGYRFGTNGVAPIRDGAPPRGKL